MLKIPLEAVGLRPDTEKVAQQVKEDLKISKEAGQHPDAAIMQKDWSWGVEEAEAAHRDNACEFSAPAHVKLGDVIS